MHSRTTSSPSHCVAVPTISMRRHPDAALTRISMGVPTSLSLNGRERAQHQLVVVGVHEVETGLPAQSSSVRSNIRSAERFPHTMVPASVDDDDGVGQVHEGVGHPSTVGLRGRGGSDWSSGVARRAVGLPPRDGVGDRVRVALQPLPQHRVPL